MGLSSWCSEPRGQGVTQADICAVPYPGDIPVRPDQHGRRSGDLTQHRKFPHADIFSVDQLDAVSPLSYIKAAGLTEVEQRRLGFVQQGEDP